ncbi:MAG TPA: acyl-CoA dehydrogenase C-terminal domain-containing protein [Usitatibacteraceae bacterium]|nr:acyl-CoA dehydrogenase C-terminal domain-containing protein [Usitatibacteraceae bacterium]
MAEYAAPLKDMQFVLKHVVGLDQVNTLPGWEEVTEDVVDAVLEEAAKFAGEVLSPLNASGDKVGAQWKDGKVITAPGFKDAYWQFVNGGWGNIMSPEEFGGQGLPALLSTPVEEMWGSANIAFKLCPMLTLGAVEALHHNASDELKKRFLPNMISGKWTGTMNLTEPQAGSDLSLVRTKAVPQPDGTFKLTGQKIFITYGDQDYTENIIHAVLARIEGAPEGVKGISLFVVPKVLVKPDGSLGDGNGVSCVSIEHKLGIHASPTAVIAYDNAVGYLVGEANRGLEYMFVMMNAARLGVGLEGVSICERAYQRARDWAKDRLQGKPVGLAGGARTAPIIQHPDVKRMLLTMKANAEATRALAYQVSALLDRARRHPDKDERRRCHALVDLLIPVVKGWSTETGIEVASLGIQVHGGMGFIEETGAAQHLRDARISTIYEGTTGIQANDLVGRKVGREAGATMKLLIGEMRKALAELAAADDAELRIVESRLAKAIDALERATDWIVTFYPADPGAVAAGSVYYLKLSGLAIGGWMMARSAIAATRQLAAGQGDAEFLRGKRLTARFFADHLLPQVDALAESLMSGGQLVRAAEEALL